MFNKKYTITFLNSKWEVIKKDIKVVAIPRRDEYIWFDEKYFTVTNVVHSFIGKHDILVVIEESGYIQEIN
jgi:hypothetical protein